MAGMASGGPIAPIGSQFADDARRLEAARTSLQACSSVIFDFLQSKGLFAAERALRTELEASFHREASYRKVLERNLWQSQIERMLEVKLPRACDCADADVEPEMSVMLSQIDAIPTSSGGQTPTTWHHATRDHAAEAGASTRSTPSRRLGVRLHQLNAAASAEEGTALRRQRQRTAQQSCVVFREGAPMSEAQAREVDMLPLPLLFNPYIRGLEDSPELNLAEHTLLAGRY